MRSANITESILIGLLILVLGIVSWDDASFGFVWAGKRYPGLWLLIRQHLYK